MIYHTIGLDWQFFFRYLSAINVLIGRHLAANMLFEKKGSDISSCYWVWQGK